MPCMGDIIRADQPWGRRKISILVSGDWEDDDGLLYVERSAYELRLAAIDSHDDPSDLIIEPAQLDKAIRRAISDRECRIAMLLHTRGGYSEDEIQDLLGSKRPGYQLLRKGVELVRREQRGNHQRLTRVRAAKGESATPVCWRCQEASVLRPGDECGECANPAPRASWGRPPAYDPLAAPDPSVMSDAERDAEIGLIVSGQDESPDYQGWNKHIPGGSYYVKKVAPRPSFGEDQDRGLVRRDES